MGITILKIFIWGGILSDIRTEIMFYCSPGVAVKLNFRPYNRRYTSPNENFEYSYPLSSLVLWERPVFRACDLVPLKYIYVATETS